MASSEMTDRLKSTLVQGGLYYSALYAMRGAVDRLRDRLDGGLTAIERKKRLIEPWTISARRFTAADNRVLWNTYDWSQRGDEWTKGLDGAAGAGGEQRNVDLIKTPIPKGGIWLEIRPGGGRWAGGLRTVARE